MGTIARRASERSSSVGSVNSVAVWSGAASIVLSVVLRRRQSLQMGSTQPALKWM